MADVLSLKNYRSLSTLGPNTQDGGAVSARATRYGEQKVVTHGSKLFELADEGSYYTIVNATPLTGIAMNIATAYVATTPQFAIKNGSSAGGPRMYLDYIRLITTVAPASATSWQAVFEVDDYVSRYTSGGTALGGGKNVNMAESNGVGAVDTAYIGVLLASAANLGSGSRIIANAKARAQIPVIFDETIFDFGASSKGGGGGHGVITSPVRDVIPMPPVVIPPQCWGLLFLFGASNAATGMSAEVEVGYYKK